MLDVPVQAGSTVSALQADDEIVFATDTELSVRNRLVLQAPNLRAADGRQRASGWLPTPWPWARPSRPPPRRQSPLTGPARLRAEAGLIDLSGRRRPAGLRRHHARRAVRHPGDRSAGFRGHQPAGCVQCGGHAGAARGPGLSHHLQRLPGQRDRRRRDAGHPQISGNGAAAAPVLSAAGKLRFAADEIVQSGAVRAPLGQIEFIARDSLTLAAGSVTSTSADGQLLPFGRVVGGTSWTYESVPGLTPDIQAPPEKRIRLEGEAISVADGALVDLSGGGDLYAYEFLPGPGGSRGCACPRGQPESLRRAARQRCVRALRHPGVSGLGSPARRQCASRGSARPAGQPVNTPCCRPAMPCCPAPCSSRSSRASRTSAPNQVTGLPDGTPRRGGRPHDCGHGHCRGPNHRLRASGRAATRGGSPSTGTVSATRSSRQKAAAADQPAPAGGPGCRLPATGCWRRSQPGRHPAP